MILYIPLRSLSIKIISNTTKNIYFQNNNIVMDSPPSAILSKLLTQNYDSLNI